jgi:cytochrome c553
MRVGWKHVLGSVVLLPSTGLLVAWLGIIDIRASTGHWPATDWFLHWVMHSSVRTAALDVEVPDLHDPAWLPAAAVHFDTACAVCHGSPAQRRSPAMLAMLPPPPDLSGVIGTWTDAQLHEIVKHGVRYTGMPAWPSTSRDDEVWQMVAFLRKLPAMTAQDYFRHSGGRDLGDGNLTQSIAYCDSCHADERMSPGSVVPVLSGQNQAYLVASLHAYREGKRPSGIMETAVATTDENLFDDIAAHYAGQPSPTRAVGASFTGDVINLVEKGNSVRKIPACQGCHDNGINASYPILWNQNPAYLAAQLRLFADGIRGGTDRQHLMIEAARNLEEQDIEALSRYFANGKSKP